MFDHRAIVCSIRVINSRCDILLDRLVVTHGFLRCGHNKLQYTVFCLLTVYLVVSSLYRSDDSLSHGGVTCQVRQVRRNYLLCNTSPRGSWTQSRYSGTGSKLIGHLRSPEVTPVRRACAYVERRSGLLDVAYRRADLRHEPLTFDVLDLSTFWTATPVADEITLLKFWLPPT